MKTVHFIAGLPRSGSLLVSNILKQNPDVFTQPTSSLSTIFSSINAGWFQMDENKEADNFNQKKNVLKSIIDGFYAHTDKNIVLDRDRRWIPQIGQLEDVLQREVKFIICVRNPAEILTSFERQRKDNPMSVSKADLSLRNESSIASRAYFYASPNGELGLSHRNIKDAITMGYIDRFLFVDYSRFCNSPISQTKRIYDFLELPSFDHDLKNIVQEDVSYDIVSGLPNQFKKRNEVQKVTVNCVEYLGLDLFEQYNREIFWNAWV